MPIVDLWQLCMLFKIMSNPMHPLSNVLPLPYVPARVTHFALVAHRHSFAPPRRKISQYRRTSVPLTVSLWNDFGDPLFAVVRLAGFRAEPMLSCCSNLLFLFVSYYFLFIFLPWADCERLGSSDR